MPQTCRGVDDWGRWATKRLPRDCADEIRRFVASWHREATSSDTINLKLGVPVQSPG